MTKNTLTFEIGGRVNLKDFGEGVTRFRRLVDALTPRSAGAAWFVHDLQPGSAVITLAGESAVAGGIERIVDEYEYIGQSLADKKPLAGRSKRVENAAAAIADFARAPSVEYVRFETASAECRIYGGDAPPIAGVKTSVGAVTGTIQVLSNRTGLRFNLYDALHDRAVACYLADGQEELMREAWGKRARVSGVVSRDAAAGRPTTVRQIVDVKILDEPQPGSHRRAKGALPWKPGDKLPEEVIRELRDA